VPLLKPMVRRHRAQMTEAPELKQVLKVHQILAYSILGQNQVPAPTASTLFSSVYGILWKVYATAIMTLWESLGMLRGGLVSDDT
jgi:hypothetical protein